MVVWLGFKRVLRPTNQEDYPSRSPDGTDQTSAPHATTTAYTTTATAHTTTTTTTTTTATASARDDNE